MRAIMIKKKRCLFFFLVLLLISLSLSWFAYHGLDGIKTVGISTIVIDKGISALQSKDIIPPKLNVLEEPPALNLKYIANRITNESKSFTSRVKIKDGQNAFDVYQARRPDNLENNSNINFKLNNISISKSTNISQNLELVKNKTLVHLAVLGKETNEFLPKALFVQRKWNLSVSFEDIGNIMKDTSFFNNLRPLDWNGPFLQSSKNRTANFSLSMPMKVGYCDCWELHCVCCAQLVNKQLHLNTTACANFTFISKSHEIDLTFSIDGALVHRQTLSAASPPLLCMGSIPTVADMCIHFSNMTYKVDRLGMHKSQLLGCTDFTFNIYNKTIHAYPVDCFQIPGDPNHHPKHEQFIIPNFVP